MIYSDVVGFQVSIVGLGTVKLGRNTSVKYPNSFDIPSDKEVLTLLNTASECGVNLIDTAPAYGNSEERLGGFLSKSNYPWIISTKVGEVFEPATGRSSYDFSAEAIQASVESSLSKLKRDCLDIVLIHSDGDDERIIREGALDILQDLKKKGLIRAVGMSSKTIEGGILAAEKSDIVMVTHNLEYQKELEVIEYAESIGKGIFIKKAFGSGHLITEGSLAASFDCIFQHEGVSSVILGTINPEHIEENIKHVLHSKSKPFG